MQVSKFRGCMTSLHQFTLADKSERQFIFSESQILNPKSADNFKPKKIVESKKTYTDFEKKS